MIVSRVRASKVTTLPWVVMVHPEDFSSGQGVVWDIRSAITSHNTRLVKIPFSFKRATRDFSVWKRYPFSFLASVGLILKSPELYCQRFVCVLCARRLLCTLAFLLRLR
jgi:hypothetical protein